MCSCKDSETGSSRNRANYGKIWRFAIISSVPAGTCFTVLITLKPLASSSSGNEAQLNLVLIEDQSNSSKDSRGNRRSRLRF